MPEPAAEQPKTTTQVTPAQESAASPTPTSPQAVVAANGVQPGKYRVGDRAFETKDQALEASGYRKDAAHKANFIERSIAGKMQQFYLDKGDLEGAEKWSKYAESKRGAAAIRDWVSAATAPDFDTAVSKFGRFYSEHINDGVDYTGHKMVTKSDGTQVAVVTLTDKATGKSHEMELTRERMVQLGAAYNPQTFFDEERAKMKEAEKIKLQAQLKSQERAAARADKREEITLTQDRLDARERIKAKLGIEESKAKAQVGIDTKIDALLGAGYSEDDVRKMMPAIVGAGEHKKTTDPNERRALIASDLLKNDPGFARKTKEEQTKRVNDVMSVIYGDEKPEGKPADKPSVAPAPMKYDPKLPVKYQKGTGKPYHLVDGKYVPIEGAIPNAASSEQPKPATPAPAQEPAPAAPPAASGLPPVRTQKVTREDIAAAEAAQARRKLEAAAKAEELRKQRLKKQEEATRGADAINNMYRR